MPSFIVALLLALGCAGTGIETPHGPAASVWICPPPEGAPDAPAADAPASPPAAQRHT